MKIKFKFSFLGIIFFNAVAISQESIGMEWTGNFGSVASSANVILVDDELNSYLIGGFQGTSDFDPGSGVYNLIASGTQDCYVLKLDSNGTFIWVKSFGGSNQDYVNDACFDSDYNIVMTGNFQSTCDFDPGPGSTPLTSSGVGSFVSVLDSAGNFIWAKSFNSGAGNYCGGYSIALDGDENILINGLFSSTVDFDPDAGSFPMTSAGAYDAFFLKLDAIGQFIWAKQIGTASGSEGASEIVIDADNNIYSVGNFYYTTDFDPGPGVFNLIGSLTDDIYLLKLTGDGNFVWAISYTGANNEMVNDFILDSNSDLILGGQFNGTLDFDPGVGVFNLTSNGSTDGFVTKIDTASNLIWASYLGGGPSTQDMVYGISEGDNDEILFTGVCNNSTTFLFNGASYPWAGTALNEDIMIGKLNSTGNLVFAKTYGINNSNGSTIYYLGNNSCLHYGTFNGTGDLDPGPLVQTYSSGSSDAFIQKLTICSTDDTSLIVTACDEYTVGGTTVNSNGTHYLSVPGIAVCDSLVELDLTILESTINIIDDTICTGFTLNSQTYLLTGTYYQYLINTVGCDSTIEINIVGNEEINFNSYSIAPGDSIQIFGSYQSIPGNYYDTLVTVNGCDSVLIQELSIDPSLSCGSVGPGLQSEWEIYSEATILYSFTSDDANHVYITGDTPFDGEFGDIDDTIVVSGSPGLFIEKITSAGQLIWVRKITGTGADDIKWITVDDNNDLVVSGTVTGTINFDPGISNFTLTNDGVFIAKYDSSGAFIWAKMLVEDSFESVYATGLITDANNAIYMTGNFSSNVDFNPGAGTTTFGSGESGQFILKLNSSGNFVWAKYLNGISSCSSSAFGLEYDSDYNLIVSGMFEYAGTIDFLSGGGTYYLTSDMAAQPYTMKMDTTGAIVWVKLIGGKIHKLDSQNNIFFSSNYYTGDTLDLDSGLGVQYAGTVSNGVYVLKTDPSGNYIWSHNFDHLDIEPIVMDISINDNIYLHFEKFGLVTLDTDPGSNVSSNSSNRPFFAISGNGCFVQNYQANGIEPFNIYEDQTGTIYALEEYSYLPSEYRIVKFGDCTASTYSNIVESACSSYLSPSGISYTSSGIYNDTIFNIAGCDSVITINLTILLPDDSTLVIVSCEDYTLNSITYTSSGTYQQVITAVNGCDSIITLELTIDAGSGSLNTGFTQNYIYIFADETAADFVWLDCDNGYAVIPAPGNSTFTASTIGNFAFEITQNGCVDTSACFAIVPDDFYNGTAYIPMHAEIFTLPISTMSDCNGYAYIAADPFGGVPPYVNTIWSSDPSNPDFEFTDSTCYGIYTFTIVDNIGDSLHVPYFITDSINYYNMYDNVGISDTLYMNAENCLLDYNLPVDSAEITQFTLIGPNIYGLGDDYLAELTYYQLGIAYTYQDTFVINTTGNQLIIIAVWCPSKSLSTIKILYSSFYWNELGVSDQLTINQPKIYPNPTNGLLYIRNAEYDVVILHDLSGREVFRSSGDEGVIDLSALSRGAYTISLVAADEFIYTQKVILAD